ncbi:MAG: VWA domain-containing protein [Deltaproteobacteria bacterium]|nr:VWA domain-containing protein [Deltaproteobacteria bacterium]
MSTLSDQLEVEAGTATPEALARQGLSRSRSRRWSSMGDAYLLFHRVKYHLTPRFPLGRREMAEAWRHLRRLQRTGRAEELDVEGTIHSICQTGFFLEPVLQPLRRNQAKLVLLIDQRGSMAPFVPIIRTLVESILRGGLLGKVNIYYFHDCPGKVLYTRQSLTGAIPLEEVLSNQVKDNSILIVSDAGAARGYYDEQRLNTTRRFLKNLHTYTYLYAWLNPIPSKRWQSTTAGIIAQLVPMFSLDRDGLNDAINILRGQPFPPGVNLDA